MIYWEKRKMFLQSFSSLHKLLILSIIHYKPQTAEDISSDISTVSEQTKTSVSTVNAISRSANNPVDKATKTSLLELPKVDNEVLEKMRNQTSFEQEKSIIWLNLKREKMANQNITILYIFHVR